MSELRMIVAEAICNATSSGVMFPWATLNEREQEAWAVMADAALAAQALAGYAVVELPEVVGFNGADNRVWAHNPRYVEQDFNGDVIISDHMGIDADELYDLGAILIAASKQAEDR